MKKFFIIILLMFVTEVSVGKVSRLWLPVFNGNKGEVACNVKSPVISVAMQEIKGCWNGKPVKIDVSKKNSLEKDGFKIADKRDFVQILATTDAGALYGVYELLRMQQSDGIIKDKVSNPSYQFRILNHWDNLNGTIERGYAGKSLWKWEELPGKVSDRYQAYARANASIGINGTVINNVNASHLILSDEYLNKVKVLADIFRPYGIKVYLSINFASPMQLAGLKTADPLDKDVIKWWRSKVKEIYSIIPDFGGFLVKANSEGQPGPCDFNRTHADGANMLADALKPYKGIVMWRAFVYNPTDNDRAKQAYLEFQPLDGQFRDNVIIQIKNGPIDFQPREPFSPLFTSLHKSKSMVEFQITQEYLGFSNHLAFLAPMWKEFYSHVKPQSLAASAGVANIGDDDNWCGNDLAQSNWYAFGRLSWDTSLSSETIAKEWLSQTFTKDKGFVEPMTNVLLESREAVVNYMMPLGLHHIFAWGHHYGPQPWCEIPGARADWLPSYYHRADAKGLGFDRTATGSYATAQYPAPYNTLYENIKSCPEEYILWFHHVPWDYTMKNGKTMWFNLCDKYNEGVDQVRTFQGVWDKMKGYVDKDRFEDIQRRFKIQSRDAVWWRDACLLYFQTFSNMEIPEQMERPVHDLKQMKEFQLKISNYEVPKDMFCR